MTELIVTIVDGARDTRCGNAARVVRTAVRKLIVSAASQSSSVTARTQAPSIACA